VLTRPSLRRWLIISTQHILANMVREVAGYPLPGVDSMLGARLRPGIAKQVARPTWKT
jgi:hypothetical protein